MFKILGVTPDGGRKPKISLKYFPKDLRFKAAEKENYLLSSM